MYFPFRIRCCKHGFILSSLFLHRYLASGSGDTTVRFWDLDTETPQFTCKGRNWDVLVCVCVCLLACRQACVHVCVFYFQGSYFGDGFDYI